MATSQMSEVIRHLRRTVLLRDVAGLTDGQLLENFISHRDGSALETLVQRHGPMVWGVCCRVLSNHHDAEDAFQVTFLVLVRKAASIASRELLPNWLYRVAYQTALKARATAAKRMAREKQVTEMPEPEAAQREIWHDLQPLLDQELSRLPDKYRIPILLCDLEGKTRREAAEQLGCPEGTVAGRLARARVLLAKRLTERGITLSGGALAVMLSQNAASACVPTSVVTTTIKTAALVAAGQAAATGLIPAKVAALTDGVMKAMFVTKIKAALVVILILGFVATGATIFASRTAAGQDDEKPTAGKPMEPAAKKVQEEQKEPVPAAKKVQEKQKEAFTAWGKEVDGLQAGLCFPPGQQRAYHYGETVTLVVRVRNVAKEEVKFQYLKEFFFENPLMVTDADGKTTPQGGAIYGGPGAKHLPVEMSLAPGQEIEFASKQFRLAQAGRPYMGLGPCPPLQVGTGKVSVQFERVFGNTHAGRIKVDPDLLKLATGKLELEIKPAPAEKK
jgi:RNA polymerase sigma factor (sigma-70 family)